MTARRSTVDWRGSKGSKPRTRQHHLPTVGSPANREWEHQAEEREVFGSWPLWLVLGVLVIVLLGWLILSL